jgi:hypothetical protein
VHVTRDIVFDELAQWDWGAEEYGDDGDNTIPFEIEVITTTEYQQEHIIDQAEPEWVGALDSPGATQEATPSPPPTPPSMHLASPPSRESDLDHDHDDASLRFRGVDNILGPVGVSSLAQRALQQELHAVNTEDPNSFVEAVNSLSWRAAMVEELKSIKDNKTWDVIDLPHGHRAIGLKWVFKAKKDEQGRVVKHKARLVAKGFVQKPAFDYEEAFAPVARMESVRLILAVAMHEGWHVHHMDVKSAFLNDKLDEVVYV